MSTATDSGTFDYFTEGSTVRPRRAARTTRPPRTTTCSCRGSPARRAAWATSASRTTRRTRSKLKAVSDREPEDGGVRGAIGQDGAGRLVQAARAPALHLREGLVVQEPEVQAFHRVHLRQREGDREAGGLRPAHAGPAEAGAGQLRSRRQGGQQVERFAGTFDRRGRPDRAALFVRVRPRRRPPPLDIFRFVNMKGATMREFTTKATGLAQ